MSATTIVPVSTATLDGRTFDATMLTTAAFTTIMLTTTVTAAPGRAATSPSVG